MSVKLTSVEWRKGKEASFTVDAYPGERFQGRVRQVRNAPINIQNVVTYDVVVEFENPEFRLKPGMTANVAIVVAKREQVLKVPNSVLRFNPPKAVHRRYGCRSGLQADSLDRQAVSGCSGSRIRSTNWSRSRWRWESPTGPIPKYRRRGERG